MKTINVNPSKVVTPVQIGYVTDHNETKLVFETQEETNNYLKLQISDHEYEPIPLTGKEWIVTSTYTDKARKYKAQLMRKIDGEYIANSPIFELVVNNSIYGNETIKEVVPPNFKTAYDNMVDITNQIKEAFENGDFNGNGIVSIEKESTSGLTDTYKIIFSDGKETKFNVTNGKGIVSIEKTNTQENIDTYTITFNDETTSTFTVTNGIDGIDGIDGTTPNIQIGTVTTLEPDQQATVERTGDDDNPVFNFGIPKGDKGDTGFQGPPGIPGEATPEFKQMVEQSTLNATKAEQFATQAKQSETNAKNSADGIKAESQKITENAEQITQIKEDLVANTKEDAKTKRSLSALWALNNGISYRFETDSEKAYKKQIPSGAKLGSVNKVGGKTIVMNQLIDPSRRDAEKIEFDELTKHFKYDNWIDIGSKYICRNINLIKGHKYYIYATDKVRYAIVYFYGEGMKESLAKDTDAETVIKKVLIATGSGINNLYFNRYKATSENVSYFDGSINLIDLTKMFGSGNEPSTPEEFEAMLPNDYYPYNEGELMSMSVNDVVYTDTSSNQNSHQITQSILSLDGYGWSAGTAYNYVDFENKKYYKCVDKRAYQSNDDTDSNVITDGTNTYYELAEPIVTDISDIIGDTFQEPFEVESGGSLTFKNTNGDGYQVAVPSDIQYTVALSEVNTQ